MHKVLHKFTLTRVFFIFNSWRLCNTQGFRVQPNHSIFYKLTKINK